MTKADLPPYEIYYRDGIDGGLACDCPSFRKGLRDPCKHIALYLRTCSLLDRCAELHETDGLSLCRLCLLSLLAAGARKVRTKYVEKSRARPSKSRPPEGSGLSPGPA
jgi:hypothetical protein